MLILRIHRSKAGIHIVRRWRWRGEEEMERCQSRGGGGRKLENLKLDVK